MNKTLATALMVLAMLSSLIFSTAPAFAASGDQIKESGNCKTLSPGVTECNDVLADLTEGYPDNTVPENEPVVPILKGTAPTMNPTPTDHAEPGAETAYPAPSVTPNTTDGVVPESANPTPAPEAPNTTAPTELANTGANDNLYIWGAVGLLALIAGIGSIIHARRKA